MTNIPDWAASGNGQMFNVLYGAMGLGFMLVFFVFILGFMVLKGVALWRAARNGHKGWFVAMFIVNLLGILEIIYLTTVGKTKKTETAESAAAKPPYPVQPVS